MVLLVLLGTKHMVVDGPIQSARPYQWQNKGTWGHPGGLEHAGLHGLGTLLCLLLVPGGLLLSAFGGLADFMIHYVVDWTKMNANSKFGWTPDKPNFWTAILVDQYAHYLTYVGIAWVVSGI
jgi:hypothetical protein